MAEEHTEDERHARDRAASRRDVDAAIRDRMADDEMSETERDARADAARDRMHAMRDRQAASQDRDEARRTQPPDDQPASPPPGD